MIPGSQFEVDTGFPGSVCPCAARVPGSTEDAFRGPGYLPRHLQPPNPYLAYAGDPKRLGTSGRPDTQRQAMQLPWALLRGRAGGSHRKSGVSGMWRGVWDGGVAGASCITERVNVTGQQVWALQPAGPRMKGSDNDGSKLWWRGAWPGAGVLGARRTGGVSCSGQGFPTSLPSPEFWHHQLALNFHKLPWVR